MAESSCGNPRAPRPRRLLSFVHLSSERTLEPVHQDSSFAAKQESHAALLLVVRCASLRPLPDLPAPVRMKKG